MTEIKVENVVVKIEQDDMDCSPREWDNLGTILYAHRRYNLGEETFDTDLYNSWEEVLKHEIGKDAIALPVYLYDHSGITISTKPFGCRWDSGQVGYIYVTKEKIRKEFGIKRVTKKWVEKITQYLESEVQVFDDYLTGNVHWVKVEFDDYEESCGGFYGSNFKENGVFDFICENINNEALQQQILAQL